MFLVPLRSFKEILVSRSHKVIHCMVPLMGNVPNGQIHRDGKWTDLWFPGTGGNAELGVQGFLLG